MNSRIGNLPQSLLLLPLLGVTAPKSRAAEPPLLPLEPGATTEAGDLRFRFSHDMAQMRRSPIAPAPSGAVEAFAAQTSEGDSPLVIAQVIPTPGAVNTQVELDASGTDFQITGGTQTGENLFHRFDQLDLNAGQVADFEARPGVETILSEIGGGPSNIDGLLKVSGGSADLFVINPAGVVLGPNAQLDLSGSFVATTADRLEFSDGGIDLLDEGFTEQTVVSGSLDSLGFAAHAAGGVIVNQGQLEVDAGQSIGLLGHAVINTGELKAPGGEVTVLAAKSGQHVSLQGELLNLELAAPVADGSSNPALWNNASQSLVEATGLSQNADGSISLEAGTVRISGNVDVSSAIGAGGTATLLGDQVQVVEAVVDASGAKGGLIQVGGDYQGQGELLRARATQVDAASVLRADGIASTLGIRPDGGEVVVWSDGTAEFAGTATARSLAPGGDGGLVETSAKQQLHIAASSDVNTTAIEGATGQWLIDPVDLTVANSGGTATIIGGVNDAGSSTIDAATVVAGLNGNNVSLQADNLITVDAPINASPNPSGGDLNLDAPSLRLNERITLQAGSELYGTASIVGVGVNGSIQNGVDAVVAGGIVALDGTGPSPATYREGQEIVIDKQIQLQGPGASFTAVSGDANSDGNAAGNQVDNHRILNLTSNADGTTLAGITFSDGIASSNGAGVRIDADDVVIEDSVFSENQALGSGVDGGAIYTNSQRLSIENTRFENNHAEEDGGAIDLQSGSVNISNSTFSDNVASTGHGGAIDLDPTNAELTITGSSFERNSAATEGGALFLEGDVDISSSSFIDNTAVEAGGAISQAGNASSTLTLVDSTFTTNRATSTALNQGDGGAVHVDADGPTVITRTDFTSNSATNDGGAIFARGESSDLTISNSDFRQNQATGDDAGALYISNGATLSLNGGTFEQNTAVDQGGAIAVLRTAQATIDGTTFANNDVTNNGGALAIDDSSVTITNVDFNGNRSLAGLGGAIALAGSGSLVSTGSNFTSNTSVLQGGAISLANDSAATLNNNNFLGNQLLVNTEGNGGAIFVNSSSANALSVDGGSFTNNWSLDDGGAVTINQGTAQFSGVSFTSNRAINGDGSALDVNAGATVIVQGGTYTGNRSNLVGGAISNAGTLTVDGATFDGNTSTNGDGGAIAIDSLELTTIRNSNFLNNSAVSGGGLFKTNSADLIISDTLFESNTATTHGGGIAAAVNSGMITLTDSNIIQNIAGLDGGGIRLDDSNLSLSDSLVSNNQAGFGAGLELSDSSNAQISNVLFQGNSASIHGGAISIDDIAVATISNSQLLNNETSNRGGAIRASGSFSLDESLVQGNTAATRGGGISLEGANSGPVSIRSTVIDGNTSLEAGGGLSHIGGQTLTILDSTFSSNIASGAWNGGALDLFPSVGGTVIEVQNSTLSGNRGGNFGGALSQAGTVQTTLNNVTVANNTASTGGGIANVFGGSLTLQNTIVAGNTAASDSDIAGSITSLGNNLVQDRGSSSGYGAADLADGTDPQLLSLADNGGLTQTHALRGFSPAVDGGNGSATLTDQRGLNLIAQRDIGAYELDNNLTAVTSGFGQTTQVTQAFANPIEVSITDSFGSAISGVDVVVSAPTAGASASLGTLRTDDGGIATTTATANTVAGTYGITLDIGNPLNLYGISLTNTPDVPDQIAVLNGNNQSTVVNTAFANPLQLTVTDQFGNPIPSQTLGVSLPSSGASASATNGTDLNAIFLLTDSTGQVTVNLTANTFAGSYGVSLTSGSLSDNATLTNLPDAPAQLMVDNGNNQSTIVNTAFANPLQVTVKDQFGNAVPGVTVDVGLPGSGASANVGTLAFTTDNAGQASTGIIANTTAGGYNLGLSVGSLTNDVQLTNLADAPVNLNVLDGNDQSAVVNTAFANPLLVEVTDQFGNVVPGAVVNLSLPTTGTSANVGSVSLTTDSLGQATTSLEANTIAGSYGIGLTIDRASNSISLSNLPDAPAQLDLLGGGGQVASVNTAFPEALRVQVFDQFGNVIPDVTVNFSSPATVGQSGASADLSGATVITDGAGQGQTLATANEQAGAYQVQAQAGAVTTTFALENVEADSLPELPDFTEDPLTPQLQSQPVKPPSGDLAIASAPLSFVNRAVVEAIDIKLSAAYTHYWGTPSSRGATVIETRAILQNALEAYGVRSAVVYGLFVPQDQTDTESFGATQVASMALNRRAQTSEQRDDDQLMLILVPQEGPLVQRLVNVTRQEMLRQARLFRMAVSDPYDEWSYKPIAQQMYSWMLEPVESELERLELDNVMYAMDSGLRTLPLAAMMKGDEFAIERYGISLIPSVDLMETNFGASAPSSQIVAAGATEFEQLNDLPAVELELDAIASQAFAGITPQETAQQHSVNVLFNEEFTQENLIQAQQGGQSNMLHLATHGEFNAGDLGSSYLQFWDDQLTLDDISKLGWDDIELLILSACQTAISSPEAELGFAGLAAATGVESTIGSLWSVSDLGTLGLMSEFYGQLSQTPLRFEALRQAQMSMLRGETRLSQQQLQTERGEIALPEEWDLPESADFSHPFYWSGFTLVGNPWW